MPTKIIVHADGACSGNPGPGGWAASIAVEGAGPVETTTLRGGDPMTTNNIMELTAAEAAIAHLASLDPATLAQTEVTIRLDSEYVIKGLRDWMPGWKAKGWRTASGSPVKNREIWERLDASWQTLSAVAAHCGAKTEIRHVKGHAGDPGNEAVDRIAVAARDVSRDATGPWRETPDRVTAGAPSSIEREAASFREEAESRGYLKYIDYFRTEKSGYLFSMQKRVKEGDDTLYFLNVDAWDTGTYTRGTVTRLALEAHAQFHTEDDMQGDAVNLSRPFSNFDAIEAFFDRAWRVMEFGRYETRPEPAPAP
jgi:ribonuclease HI